MGKIIKMTLHEVRPLTESERAELKLLRELPDSTIDYSDIPEITEEDIASGKLVLKHGGARPGAGRKKGSGKIQSPTEIRVIVPASLRARLLLQAKKRHMSVGALCREKLCA